MKKIVIFIYFVQLFACTSLINREESPSDIANAILQGKIENLDEIEESLVGTNNEDGKNKFSQTFLHLAAKSGRPKVVQFLVKKGYDINALDLKKNTPLHYAIINGHIEMAKFLIKNGANVNAKNINGTTPIHLAALSLPIKNKEIPSVMPTSGRYTSLYGIRMSPFSTDYRFHQGVDIGAPIGTPIKATADGKIIKAGWSGSLGKAVFVQHLHGHISVYGHCSELKVKSGFKVKQGEIIALVGSTGRSTGPHLHYELRLQGFKINPLPFIPKKGSGNNSIDELLKLLAANGANINSKDYTGRTPLHYAVIRDYNSSNILISMGAYTNVKDKFGLTPLHFAAGTDLKTTNLLLKNGAKVNIKTTRKYTANDGKYFYPGTTPMKIALKNEWLEMAKLLMKYGGME